MPIRTVPKLVRTIAPITRMLRTKVTEQLAIENANVKRGESLGQAAVPRAGQRLAQTAVPGCNGRGVRQRLMPKAVTFALLLARTEGQDLEETSLHEIGQKLGTDHSLMGKALQLLTQDVKGDFLPTMELLKRVIGAVQWDAVRKNKDTYLHLYEKFLDGVRPGTSQGHRHVLHTP